MKEQRFLTYQDQIALLKQQGMIVSDEKAAEEILARLRCGEVPAGVRQEDDRFFYACTISPTQTLRVEVQICGTDAPILRWQAVSTAQWETDENLPVWNGGEEGAAP